MTSLSIEKTATKSHQNLFKNLKAGLRFKAKYENNLILQ